MAKGKAPKEQATTQPQATSPGHQVVEDGIAIVGMAAMYPKSPDLKGFWHLIRAGVDGISEVPDTHWSPDDYFDADQKAPDMTYCRRGGFLPGHRFDPTEFSLPPTVLEATDTSQLLGLVTAKAALEDAGYGSDRTFNKETTSVILGVTGTLELVVPLGARLGHPMWKRALEESGVAAPVVKEVMARMSDKYVGWQENSFPGLLGNVVAGRIANRLDLHGTNCVVDAACASSLSAAHLAILELSTGKADMVITGGADTFNDIFMYMCFSKTPALSASGKIRPFSEESDGTLIGEGLGMIVLKRASQARADGDRIYAIIKGVGTASDGNSGAVYAPDSKGQARALRDAYKRAGVSPSVIRLVEAHGTGTKVGDVVEFEGLRSVYAEASERKNYVALGSVKSQIGHTKAAAGSASLIKAALALYHKVLPPTLGVDNPNPKLKIEESAFYINNVARPWISEPELGPRRAALSSFGFGGSNFHMVLEEAQAQRVEPAWDGSVRLWAASAASADALALTLKQAAESMSDAKDREGQARAAAASCAAFKSSDAHRCVLVWNTDQPLSDLLRSGAAKVAEGKPSNGPEVFYSSAEPGKVAVMFPGQGSQYVNMGREWACVFPEVLDSIERSERSAAGLSGKLYPPPTFTEGLDKGREAALTATDAAQPALGAINAGMFDLFHARFGLTPDFTCGHSYGELVALYAAGVYDADALSRLSALRGELMARGDGGRGAMAAVSAPLDKIEAILPELGPDVVIANRNSPGQCVLSGTKEAIAAAQVKLKEAGMRAVPLAVGAAFHSPLVASAEAPFREGLSKAQIGAARFPVVANKTAEAYPSDANAVRDLLANQLVSQVNWVGQVEKLYEQGVRLFVELGPKNVLSKLTGACLKGRPHQVLTLDASGGKNGLLDAAALLAGLASSGVPVQLAAWETAPAEGRKRKMTVELTGANYRSSKNKNLPPVRAANSVDVLPPVSSAPKATTVAVASATPTVAAQTQALPAAAPAAASVPAFSPAPQPVPAAAPQPAPVAASQQVAPSPAVQEAFGQVQASLLAMQALQHQAAQTHQRFLEGQGAAMRTFQTLVEGQQQLMARLGHGGASAPAESFRFAPAPSPMAPAAPQPAAFVPPAPVAAPVRPAASSAPAAARPAAAVVAQPAAPAARPTAAVAPAAVARPAAAAASSATAAAPAAATADAVLAVVAEKTGYPVDMLNLEMDLEADLGIDSIKRVEILAAAQERLPHLTAVASDQLGSLRTLREVVAAMGSAAPVAGASAPAAASSAPVASALLEVVAEKTGYPVDMLNLEMDLEADLGIDSIKRVEILAAIEEKVPGLPKVASDQMGSLRTLGQIVSAFGAVAAPAASAAAPAATGSAPVASALLEVVAEKTGYPVDMLNLDMDLEADLGIDSIKRVEILAAIEEKVPGLPKVASDQMGSLRTLGQIVSAFGAVAASAAAAPSAPAAGGAPVASALLDVVAEKTGYPVDMLNLDMDLESDLGIDSIKRVEILAAIEEKVPGLPRMASDQMSSLRTLGQIVGAFGASAAPAAAPVGAPAPVAGALLQVVAEKTGYPVDMLNLEMDLEADLGIDSIKRVEILAAIEEQVPGIPKVASDQMGSLRTLGQIVQALGGSAAPISVVEAPPAASGNSSDVERQLLEVVAEKTGYPVDMLNLDMDLEADLGVDSIKRVEILASIPQASSLPSDQVGSLRTLRQILGALGVAGASASAVSAFPAGQAPAVAPASRLERRVLQAVDLPILESGSSLPLSSGSRVAVFGLDTPLGAALKRKLEAAGMHVVGEAADDVAGLFLLGDPNMGLSDLRVAFQWTRSCAASIRKAHGVLVSVARLDGRFGTTGNFPHAQNGALTGLPKTAAHEWEGVTCRAFDVDATWEDTDAVSSALLAELSVSGPLEVGLSAQGRCTLDTPLQVIGRSTPLLQPGDVTLVTGGARGVTAATAIALAQACQPTLVLLGRSPLPQQEPAWAAGVSDEGALKKAILQNEFGGKASPRDIGARFSALQAQREVHATLNAIRAAGAQVEYRSVDVRDGAAVSGMIREITESLGPVKGLVHGAGVLADKRIEEKTDEMFDSVFATKIIGLDNLMGALAESPLKAILLFSSVTARFGRPGQVDYCMANDLLNKWAQAEARRRPDCRVVSLNWGPWGGGMVTEGLKKEFQKLGVGLIELQAGAQALVDECCQAPGGAVEVLYGDGFPAPPPQTGGSRAAASAPGSSAPLLQLNVSTEELPCLESHQVGGRPVVPVALQLEWFAQAALTRQLGSRFRGLSDLQIMRPVAIEAGATLALQVVANGDTLELQNAQTGQVFSRAKVELGADLPAAPAQPALNGLAQTGYGQADIYRDHLFHGPHFHAVHSVEGWSQEGLVAQVGTVPKMSDWVKHPTRSDWVADPLAVDAALQLGILWGIEVLGKPSLPMKVGAYQQFQRKFPKGGVQARLRVAKSTPSKVVATVDFVDAGGALVARLSDVEWTADASLKQAFGKEPASSPR